MNRPLLSLLNKIDRWFYKIISKEYVLSGFLLIVIFSILYKIGQFLPVGFDWQNFFSKAEYPPIWMPWTKPIVNLLDLPAIFALTVMAIGLRVYLYKSTSLAIVLALISFPTLWVMFLGNLDGLALVGLLTLPLGVPLVLIKPQIAAFALLANNRNFITATVWILISFLIWGFWPFDLLTIFTTDWRMEWTHDITLFPWGLLIAIPLIWFSRGDEDLLMAAGSLGTPHLFVYHFTVLMPALARMQLPWMLITWLISWTPLLSNWFGDWAWHFGNLIGICFWLGIYLNRNREKPAGDLLGDENQYQDKLDRWSSHSIIKTKLRGYPSGTRILDVGTASGTLGRSLAERKFLIYGIEPNTNWTNQAKPYYKEIISSKLEDVQDEYLFGYDVIICADVLEHTPNPEMNLMRLANLQSNESKFIISIPNIANIWIRLNLTLGRFDYSDRGILDRTHLRFFTKRSLIELIDSSGLKISSLEVTPIPLDLIHPFFYKSYLGKVVKFVLYQVTRLIPTLLGYQFIVEAERKSEN